MSQIDNLDDLLKIPQKEQTIQILKQLNDRRSEIANIFFDKNKSNEDRMKVFDELTKLHKYFGMKLPFELGKKSTWKGPAAPQAPKEPSADERAYALDLFWKTALPLVDARVKVIVKDPAQNHLHEESERKYYEELALKVWLGKSHERRD
jgi:hypothetical protein